MEYFDLGVELIQAPTNRAVPASCVEKLKELYGGKTFRNRDYYGIIWAIKLTGEELLFLVEATKAICKCYNVEIAARLESSRRSQKLGTYSFWWYAWRFQHV